MITVMRNYKSINRLDMSDNFIIRSEKVLRVWNIHDNKIGISFISSYDKYPYQITLEGKSEGLLASSLLASIKSDIDTEILGQVRIKQ